MKKSISLTLAALVLGLSSSALAAKSKNVCPAGTVQKYKCLSTPIADGSEDMAGNLLDSILVCAEGEKIQLVLKKGRQIETGEAEVIRRVGGNSYVLRTENIDFSLSHATGIAKPDSVGARFAVSIKALDVVHTSTYTCKR